MTALAAAACLPAVPDDGDDRAARLWEALDEEFLAVMSWDPGRWTVTFPQGHPLLGRPGCAVSGCSADAQSRIGLCLVCQERRAGTPGLSLAAFCAVPRRY